MVNMRKYFSGTYLTAADLAPLGKKWLAIVERVEEEAIGREKEMKPVLYLSGAGPHGDGWKPIILNRRNIEVLTQAFGDESAEWNHPTIEVWSEITSYQGKPGIRLAPVTAQPAAAPGNGTAADPNDEIPF